MSLKDINPSRNNVTNFNRTKHVNDLFNINKEMYNLDEITSSNRFFLSKKEVKDLDEIKKMVRRYENMGYLQVREKIGRLNKLYELANGRINQEEFKVAKDTYNHLINKVSDNVELNCLLQPETSKVEEVELKFFPLMRPVLDSIKNQLDKKYTKMYVKAVNPEAANDIIEQRNNQLRQLLVEQATRLFESTLEGLNEETQNAQREIFEKSQKIQEYYQKDLRLDVEEWANHVLNIEDQKFRIKDLEQEILEKILVTDHDYIRVEYNGFDYKYVPVDERLQFELRSPMDEDASQYMMFGEFAYTTIDGILGKYKISEEDAKKLEGWSDTLSGIVTNHYESGRIGDPNANHLELTTEYLRNQRYNSGDNSLVNDIYPTHSLDYSEVPHNLIRETRIHFKVPRKKGLLTYLVNGIKYSTTVDEDFKVYIKPEYDLTWTKERSAENLIHGEHIEWYYETESWTAIKLDVSTPQIGLFSDYDSIWVKLERDEIQVKDPYKRFTTILPVHGGRSTRMGEGLSLVEKGMPFQSIYNFLGNRVENLLATEIGLFFAINEGIIPNVEEGSEGNALLQMAQRAHDLGITNLRRDPNSFTGQDAAMFGAGYGQVIDLTKTNDVIAKMNLMGGVKREFYGILGLSPEMMSEISPYQSSKAVTQGLQRSSNMIHHYYKRVKNVIRRARQTGLYFAKYLQEKNPVDLTYTTNEGLRVAQRFLGKDYSLADLAIFLNDDLDDVDRLQDLVALVMNDNTMGADSFEKATMLFSKTSSEVIAKLKDLKLEKELQIQKDREFQQQQQQQAIEAQNAQLERELQVKREMDERRMSHEVQVAEIKSLGYANSEVEAIKAAIESTNAQYNKERDYDLKLRTVLAKEKETQDKLDLQKETSKNATLSKESIELMKIKQREKEIEATNDRTKAMLALKVKEKNKA